MLTCRIEHSAISALMFLAATLPGSAPVSAQELERSTVIADVLKSKIVQGSGIKPSAAAAVGLTSEPDASLAAIERALGAKMSNAERVNIRIPGYPVLSGEYRINGDGTLSLPGIGRLEIGELSIAEFEKQLASEISGINNRDVSVAIEIVDYRPVFVSGVVARSGSFPWKPGLTVLHAEALAGGLFRGSTAGEDGVITSTTDRERERAVRSAYDLAATLALITRLKTERSHGSTFALPARVASLISKSEQESLAAAQLATLQSRSTVFANRVAAAENTKALAVKEKSALASQRLNILDQLAKRRATLKKVEIMTGAGYTRGDRLFDEQVRIAELEERLTNVTIAISRLEIAAAAAQQELDAFVLGRRAEIDMELLSLEQRTAQLEIEIESANGSYQRVTGHDAIASRSTRPVVATYEIVRLVAGKSTVINAGRSTTLQPNDVLVVNFARKNAS